MRYNLYGILLWFARLVYTRRVSVERPTNSCTKQLPITDMSATRRKETKEVNSLFAYGQFIHLSVSQL